MNKGVINFNNVNNIINIINVNNVINIINGSDVFVQLDFPVI